MRWNLIAAASVIGLQLCASDGRASEFTESAARAAETMLTQHFEGKPGGIVVGLIDADGSRVVGAGTFDDGSGRPVDGDTLFFIGSVSKTFTTLLLADMVERGEVQLGDPVAKYMPASVKMPTFNGTEITLLHLATNSAGFPINPDNMHGADEREQYESYSIDDMYDYLGHFQLSRAPGTKYEYSNLGMSLLGHAMARRAGKSFEELVVERICRPLGMTSTCVVPQGDSKSRVAMGRDEAGQSTGPWQLDALIPAGAIHSTANDLLKYAAAQAGITQTPAARAIAETHVIRFEDAVSFADDPYRRNFGRTGMAWMDRGAVQPPGMELLGHAGGAGSYHAWVGFDLKQRRGVVLLTTANHVTGEAIGWTLLQRLPLTEERLHAMVEELIGIGAALDLNTDTHEPRITQVLPQTPAEEAGLTAGLVIQRVDDVATRGKALSACVDLIRGPASSKVRLVVFDPDKLETRTVEVTRRKFRT